MSLFKVLDLDQNQELECFEFCQILQKNGMIINEGEGEFLTSRFERKGKLSGITLKEFKKELTTTPAPRKFPELDEIISAIQNQMEIERKVETFKQELIKLKEFNFKLIYQLFDDNETGSISLTEFKSTLRDKLEFQSDQLQMNDVSMLFKTFSTDSDGKLS